MLLDLGFVELVVFLGAALPEDARIPACSVRRHRDRRAAGCWPSLGYEAVASARNAMCAANASPDLKPWWQTALNSTESL